MRCRVCLIVGSVGVPFGVVAVLHVPPLLLYGLLKNAVKNQGSAVTGFVMDWLPDPVRDKQVLPILRSFSDMSGLPVARSCLSDVLTI
jgi:hypothetical protein